MTEIIKALAYPTDILPADDDALFALVLDGVDSEHTRRAYRRALADFVLWYRTAGRPDLSKAIVQAYKVDLEKGRAYDAAATARTGDLVHLRPQGAASVNLRLSAIRKMAVEASDNGLLPATIAGGIRNVKGARQEGTRSGNWLTREQAQDLLNAPDLTTLKGHRDRALLAVLLGCGLRRDEASRLTFEHIQQRDGRWAIVDIVGKRSKVRTVPMPTWAKMAVDSWAIELGMALGGLAENSGRVFRAVNRGDRLAGDALTPQAIRDIVVDYAGRLGLGNIAPHDLRRTFAKLARRGGADLEQIQLSLGHASVTTTARYIGTRQDFQDAPADRLGLRLD